MVYIIVSFIVTISIIIFYLGYRNTTKVSINKIQIGNHHATSLRNKLNVLQISDIHIENLSISPDTLYSLLRHNKIDLIALTGDFLDRKRSIPKLIPYLKVFNKLNPSYGIYAVFGNHDYVLTKKSFQQLKSTLAAHNCIPLQNEMDSIEINGQLINIIGIDDFSTKKSNLTSSFKHVNEGYNLVLTHDPNIVLHMDKFHFDYLLSGHFHGGQIHWPKPYHLIKMGRLVRLNMIKGLHKHNGRSFYISEGLGQTGVNVRFGSRPEITLHSLSIPPTIVQESNSSAM